MLPITPSYCILAEGPPVGPVPLLLSLSMRVLLTKVMGLTWLLSF